jgi:hypothetical protein
MKITEEKFQVIEYAEIEFDKTKVLLKEQGLLLIDLGWFRTHILLTMFNRQEKLESQRLSRTWLPLRILEVAFDILRLVPLSMMGVRLIELHCIFVNYCSYYEWKKLSNGKYRFTLL